MATLRAYQTFSQQTQMAFKFFTTDLPVSYQLQGGTLTQATWNTTAGTAQTYYGQIHLTGDISNATGYLSGYEERSGGASGDLIYSINSFGGAGLDVQSYTAYFQALNSWGLQQTVFAGNDSFYGSQGADFLFAFDGDDTIYGGGGVSAPTDGGDSVIGGLGNDVIYGNGGNDVLHGGRVFADDQDGNDTIYGGAGDDIVVGSGGADTLYGNEGSDILAGGSGNDTLSGGAGNDVFVVLAASGIDTITDFAEGDILSVQGTGYQIAASDANGVYLVTDSGAGIVLAGVSAASLDASDFFFWAG